MKYERMELTASAWWLPEGVKLYRSPSLPTIELKKGKVCYEVTDLRCLNEKAVDCFQKIISEVCNTPDCEEVSFMTVGVEEDELYLICDIVAGISYTCRKKGRNGYETTGRLLCDGSSYCAEENKLTFSLMKDHAKAMYEYARGKKEVNYYELAIAVAERQLTMAKELLTQLNE